MKRLFLFLPLILSLLTSACGGGEGAAIQASGQIEATEVAIAAEQPGRVIEVLVDEGDAVHAGDALLRLDEGLLQTERAAAQAALDAADAGLRAAQAALESAQAQYDLTLAAALAEEQPGREDFWRESKPGEFDQPIWYFSKDERLRSAQAEIESAGIALEAAQSRLVEMVTQAGSADFLQIERELSDARAAFEVAKAVLDHTNGASESARLHDAAQAARDDARDRLNDAQEDYDDALTTDGARDVLKARAEVQVARERYYTALDALRALQTGEQALAVVAADKSLEQAAALVAQARSAVDAARANLDLVEARLEQIAVRAPVDGIILVRSVEVGEVIQAGAPLLTVGQLDRLTVTVYIPETHYGRIQLGQSAVLTTDSFTGEPFSAAVTRIADQAEFTPQNVQTQEGRQSTVYAVELSVEDAGGHLKPGMPVDVVFEAETAAR